MISLDFVARGYSPSDCFSRIYLDVCAFKQIFQDVILECMQMAEHIIYIQAHSAECCLTEFSAGMKAFYMCTVQYTNHSPLATCGY